MFRKDLYLFSLFLFARRAKDPVSPRPGRVSGDVRPSRLYSRYEPYWGYGGEGEGRPPARTSDAARRLRPSRRRVLVGELHRSQPFFLFPLPLSEISAPEPSHRELSFVGSATFWHPPFFFWVLQRKSPRFMFHFLGSTFVWGYLTLKALWSTTPKPLGFTITTYSVYIYISQKQRKFLTKYYR